MRSILCYLNDLPPCRQSAFADRCDTSVSYLRKAVSVGQRLGAELCIRLERESEGVIRCEEIRPDVDWAWLRNSGCECALNQTQDPARIAQAATKSVAQGVAHG